MSHLRARRTRTPRTPRAARPAQGPDGARGPRAPHALAAAVAAALVFPPLPAAAAPADRPVGELLRELRTVYERAESASAAYDRTAAALKRQRGRTDRAEKALSSVREALAGARRDAGRIARRQYRDGDVGLPPVVQLLLSRAPQGPRDMADRARLLQRAADQQALTVHRLAAGERRQREITSQARKALVKQQRLADRERRQQTAVRARLRQVQSTLASLTDSELASLGASAPGTGYGPGAGYESGAKYAPGTGHGSAGQGQDPYVQPELRSASVSLAPGRQARRKPSRPGATAVRFALRQLGKPYRLGAEGPHAFDCSGLTSAAWRKAGRTIPRTSQEQWRRLRRVPLNRLRPGDLVVYYKAASHVAMYAGRGKVVHAPRPGTRVRLAKVRGIPAVQGAVRPDWGTPPLLQFTLPRLLG